MGQSRTEHSIWSSDPSARAQRRRQKVTDAFIAARWLPTLAYVDVCDPEEAALIAAVTSSTTPSASQNLSQDDRPAEERTAAAAPRAQRRRPSLFRYLSRSSTSKMVVPPADPVEDPVPREPPPPYESLSRASSRDSELRPSPRARFYLSHHERVSTWLAAPNLGLDNHTAAAAPNQMPCRVQRAASAASADSGYASLFAVRSRTEAGVSLASSPGSADGPALTPERQKKRCFSLFPIGNSGMSLPLLAVGHLRYCTNLCCLQSRPQVPPKQVRASRSARAKQRRSSRIASTAFTLWPDPERRKILARVLLRHPPYLHCIIVPPCGVSHRV